MRILVTGAAGFIGGHLVEQFVRDGPDVTVLDTLRPFYDLGINERKWSIASETADGEVMNIRSGGRITIDELARVIRDEIDSTIEIRYEDVRKGDAKHTHVVSKAKRLIGYEPSVSIKEGARKFVSWYQENKDWYDPLVRNS